MSEVGNTEKLIELVRERSLLYDLSDVDYKKAEAWLEIATEMGFGESKIWIAKWKSLRDNYNKYKKNNESSTGQAYKKYKSWPWASQLRFLDDFNFRRQTETNSQRTPANNHTTVTADTENSTMNETQNTTDSEVSVYATGPSKQIPRKRIKTSVDPSDSDKILEYLKNKNEQKTKMDGVDHFFLSYAQTLKTFPPRMQSIVKLEMASLFSRYELQVAEGSDASAPSSVNQRSCSSTTNSESVPSPYDQYAIPRPVSEQFPEPANASNQQNRVVYVLSPQSTPVFHTTSTPQPPLTGNLTEYYENMPYSLDDSINK
ncbi:uncharacterized protein LOC133524808 [Cydia pomonella]|uniref:uncharacterized protein LOC133524808 n=1 Tax=Cydia pomonella TaxID=82600 RepID=UPI002ADE77DA|nr:uncharacterized protein LOC133524808 [Cydia pomonella]